MRAIQKNFACSRQKIEENGVVRGADAKEDSIKQRWKEN